MAAFRRAGADDREALDSLTLAGVRYWGHDVNHPDAYRGLVRRLAEESGPEHHLVYMLEDQGQMLGFFELRDHKDHVELLRMFLLPELIGQGYGSQLWDEAIARAGESHRRMLIMSDPGARGFYEAMGATLKSDVEVAPGFVLGEYWFTLRQGQR